MTDFEEVRNDWEDYEKAHPIKAKRFLTGKLSAAQKKLFEPFLKKTAPYKSEYRNKLHLSAYGASSWNDFQHITREQGYAKKSLGQIWRRARS